MQKVYTLIICYLKSLFFCYLLLFTSLVQAQCPPPWTCNQKCNTGPCSGTGVHLDASNNIVLTEDGSNTTTSMWDKNYVSMTKGFTLEFDINLGNRDALGGEGMTFMMQTLKNNPTAAELTNFATAIGYGGGNLGQGCAPKTANNSIAVEFDTYDNTNEPACTGGCHTTGDLVADHISINKENCSATKMDGTVAPAVQASPTSTNIEDGAWHKVRISWVPDPPSSVLGPVQHNFYCDNACCSTPGTFVNSCGQTVSYSSIACNTNYTCQSTITYYTTGTMKVFFDNMTTPRIIQNFDVHKLLNPNGAYGSSGTFDVNNQGANSQLNVMFGFTSSTEGKTNFQAIKGFVILPVKYSHFNVIKTSNNSAKVTWTTYEEKNSAHFIVQRSLDGEAWISLGKVEAAGHSSSSINYSYLDNELAPHSYYYRLLQVDIDGTPNYSNVEFIDLRSLSPLVEIYPNPVNSGDNIKGVSSEATIQVELYDLNGQLLLNLGEISKSEFNIPTRSLSPGVYFVKISSNAGGIATKKVIIL